MRDTQDETLDKVDSLEAAILGLTEAVAENTRQIAELHNKLDAIMAHQNVPYEKPPMGLEGFTTDVHQCAVPQYLWCL